MAIWLEREHEKKPFEGVRGLHVFLGHLGRFTRTLDRQKSPVEEAQTDNILFLLDSTLLLQVSQPSYAAQGQKSYATT